MLAWSRSALPWFLLAVALLHILLGLQSWQTRAAERALPREWLSLWSECRSSIEQARAVRLEGLKPVEPSTYDRFDLHSLDRWQLRTRPGSRFTVHESETGGVGGTVRRRCKVTLAPGAAFLNVMEENGLLRAFLDERNALVAGRTHEFRGTDSVPPLIVFALQNAALSDSGCLVVHLFTLDRESATLDIDVVETVPASPVAADGSCGARSTTMPNPV